MLKKIKLADYQELTKLGKIIETDAYGPKVICLPEQRILKLFRRKRILSSQIWTSYASRFAQNAKKLSCRGIPTIEVESTFYIPEIQRQAVLYKMLEGETLRDWLDRQTEDNCLKKMEDLGRFIAKLHSQGILFRSLHFGNVLVQSDGELGLIDIADAGIRTCGALSIRQRIRNFQHMDRQDADRRNLSSTSGKKFLETYLKTANLPASKNQELTNAYESIFKKYSRTPNV